MSAHGLCECGCGQRTSVPSRSSKAQRFSKGVPRRFIRGHNPKRPGPNTIAQPKRNVYFALAEKALGHPLPKGAQVHHINRDCFDNSRGNLLICESSAYHHLLHRRLRALRACGNPDARRCDLCHQWGVRDAGWWVNPNRPREARHKECNRLAQRQFRARREGQAA